MKLKLALTAAAALVVLVAQVSNFSALLSSRSPAHSAGPKTPPGIDGLELGKFRAHAEGLLRTEDRRSGEPHPTGDTPEPAKAPRVPDAAAKPAHGRRQTAAHVAPRAARPGRAPVEGSGKARRRAAKAPSRPAGASPLIRAASSIAIPPSRSPPASSSSSPFTAPTPEGGEGTFPHTFFVLHYSGGGFSNQVVQLRNHLHFAHLAGPGTLACLPPFLRRRSDSGRPGPPHLPFDAVFSPEVLAAAVPAAAAASCAKRRECGRSVDWLVVFCCAKSHKGSPEAATRERGYNVQGHRQLSGFTKVRQEKLIAMGRVVLVERGWAAWSEARMAAFLRQFRGCVELMWPFSDAQGPHGYGWYQKSTPAAVEIFRHLELAPNLEAIVDSIRGELFGSRPFAAVHLRVEEQPSGESYCRKARPAAEAAAGKAGLTAHDRLCFLDPALDETVSLYRTVFLSSASVLRPILEAEAQVSGAGAPKPVVYLASDIPAGPMLTFLRQHVKLVSYRDSVTGQGLMATYGHDVVSIIEQAICSRSALFLGTSYSTWTAHVADLRARAGGADTNRFLDRLAARADPLVVYATPP